MTRRTWSTMLSLCDNWAYCCRYLADTKECTHATKNCLWWGRV